METKQADSELKCGFYCAKNQSCTSINYKTSGEGKGRCELNNKTVEEISHVDHKIHSSEASPTIWSCYVNLNHYHYSFL